MKIIIVGGGTAGWISALILKNETDHEITLIDSSTIGPLGVGESTTGLFSHIIRSYLQIGVLKIFGDYSQHLRIHRAGCALRKKIFDHTGYFEMFVLPERYDLADGIQG